jgi:PAS domain S-box-containing protein
VTEGEALAMSQAGLAEGLDALRALVIDRSHDLITILDPVGTILYASPSWQATMGWDPEALTGTPVLELVHPADHAKAAAGIADVVAGGQVESITARMRAADERWVTVESTGTPYFDRDGTLLYVLGTARDVTEREELRERVREVDALYTVADAIARASSLEDLFTEAIDVLIDTTSADRASVLLYDDDGDVMRFVAWRELSDAYRAATEGHSPWAPDAIEPEPVLLGDAAAGPFDESVRTALHDEAICALAFIPLVHGGRLLGKFMLYRGGCGDWSDREVRLCKTIANHLASATVRTRARTALRESREQLEAIMQTVDEGIIVQSADGVVYANDGAARIIGFESAAEFLAADRDEVIERFEMLDEAGRPLTAANLPGRRALAGEAVEMVIRYRVRATGVERWSVVRANPVTSPEGASALSVSVIHDVSETKRVEQRVAFLARASELLNETLEVEGTLASLAALAVPAFAGHVTVDLYEDGVLQCVGARHIDPEKTELMIELRREYPPTVPEHPVQRALATGEPQFVQDVQAEAESMAHDERHAAAIHELANTSGIVIPLTAHGRTFGAITFGTVPPQPPFTENDLGLAAELGRRASAALDNALLYREVESRAHAAQALEFVDDGVLLVDRTEIVRILNPAAAKVFGIKPAKAIGRAMEEVVSGWQEVRERVNERPQLLPVGVKGTERWLSISAVRFDGGTVYAFRDMTEERAVEQMKSDFVSTVSHELRTPLAAIYGAALTLQRDDIALEESQRDGLLSVIAGEADRLARIVNDILWASRLDSGQMRVAIESCDGEQLTRRVVDALSAHAPNDIELVVEAASELPPAAADPDKLRQVLTNLIDNAVKYSPDGGCVRVQLTQAGGRVRFRVQDQGLGIPPAEQSRVFEKFFRLDPNLTRGVGGTGLGLYICRELVHRMHGRIWVVSDGRRGSTFTVELPVA